MFAKKFARRQTMEHFGKSNEFCLTLQFKTFFYNIIVSDYHK